jgi:molecular chaperone DnaJ
MDFYIVLGVRREATAEDIRRAYRRLARRLHPDLNPGDGHAASRFEQVVQAYETLVDPERRRRYDSGAASAAPDSQTPGFGFRGFDFSPEVHARQTTTFGDLFEDVFARREATDVAPQDGGDLFAQVALSFAEAWRGTTRAIAVTRQRTCSGCVGMGVVRAVERQCGTCDGHGAVQVARGHMVFSKACPQCQGAGVRRLQPCSGCAGGGVVAVAEQIDVEIPAGITHGDRLRWEGGGHAGRRGGRPGDLYLDVTITPHEQFRRDGDEVTMVLPVGVHEAGLGARVTVETPEGPVAVRVPPGVQAGQRLRLRERGMPRMQGGRGDLLIEIRIVMPTLLDERSKELLREFGRIHGEHAR